MSLSVVLSLINQWILINILTKCFGMVRYSLIRSVIHIFV
jgi:hypothetical protein